jgi:FkbM family methyltransferase
VIGPARLRIRGGPNRGAWWSLASGGRGVLGGRFERARVDAFVALVRPGDVVWDIGAHKGYMTLAAARLVGAAGRVYALEPAAENLTSLRRHVAWNGLHNVEIRPVAVSNSDGTRRFGGRGSSVTFKLDRGDQLVETRTLQSLLDQGLPRPDVLKIDVEGAESDVLRGAGAALHDDVLAMIAVHSRAQYESCTRILTERGLDWRESARMQDTLRRWPGGWSADPDLIAGAARLNTVDGETWLEHG